MSSKTIPVVASCAVALTGAIAANASTVSASAPGSYGDLVASYDPIASGYNWPANTGHRWEIAPGLIGDQTELRSDVFRVNQNIAVGTGPDVINLSPGDMVFAYTITLVNAVHNTTITSLDKFSVSGIPLFANGVSCRDRLIPFEQNIPGSEMLGITMPPAHMQKEYTSRSPRAVST